MADAGFPPRALPIGYVLVAMLGLLTPARATADAPPLRLQSLTQGAPGGCVSFPELDDRVAAEVKQLTGRSLTRSPAAAVNPTLTPAESVPLFGGYLEPLDDGWWRARLWLKEAGTTQVAVRDAYYQTLEMLTAELPQDAAALILLPDWSRTASALPRYCSGQTQTASYPEDACDPFLPSPSCGVPFDCTQSDQRPRCPNAPTCGVAGKPLCTPPDETCRVRDWRFPAGITALVAGGVALTIGGLLHFASTDGRTQESSPDQTCGGGGYPSEPGSCYFNGMPAAITSYVTGGVLIGAGAGLLGHWGSHAKTAPCNKGN